MSAVYLACSLREARYDVYYSAVVHDPSDEPDNEERPRDLIDRVIDRVIGGDDD